jgi:hypothetical protein
MLGLGDPGVALAYVLCLFSAVLCVGYGIVYWNRGANQEPPPTPEDLKWAREEAEIEETLG